MALRFDERTNNAEPSGAFNVDAGQDVRTYVLWDDETNASGDYSLVKPQRSQIQSKIREVLGLTYQYPSGPPGGPGGPGSIGRLPPLGNPVCPNLFADGVAVAPKQGDANEPDTNADPSLAITPAQGHALYAGMEFAVSFTHRPYAIFPNERLTQRELTFFDVYGVEQRLYFYREWLRYTFIKVSAPDIRVSASKAASMKFRLPVNHPDFAAFNQSPFDGIPDMIIPDVLLTIEWYGVPERYVSHPDSHLVKYKGFINQTDFWRWPKASLLYLGADVIRTYSQTEFLPAVIGQEQAPGPGGAPVVTDEYPELAGTFGGNVCVDLALNFILTSRTTDAPLANDDIINKNWIPLGHNLLPHFQTKKFFYATASRDERENWQPSYFSVPHEILFQDPENPNTVGVL